MRVFSYLTIVVVLLYGAYNAYLRHQFKTTVTHAAKAARTHPKQVSSEAESKKDPCFSSAEHYITQVILHGSNRLHFKPDEVMEAGFASKEDAPKIACYVEVLAGRKRAENCPADAPMYYSSNCAGCHGEDAKGLHGTYPDLTRDPLLGFRQPSPID